MKTGNKIKFFSAKDGFAIGRKVEAIITKIT